MASDANIFHLVEARKGSIGIEQIYLQILAALSANICRFISKPTVRLEDQLGIHLCQRLDWHSQTKLPTPLKWVGIRRVRVTPSVEPLLWFSTTPDKAKGNNRHVLRPYSESGLRSIRGSRNDLVPRPSGIQFGATSFQDCGGSIPSSLISATPSSMEEHRYRRAVRAAGRKAHPAIMPAAVARFVILLATDENDIVYDPMAGSGTSVIEAIKLGRYGIASERSREYLESAFIRSQAEELEPEYIRPRSSARPRKTFFLRPLIRAAFHLSGHPYDPHTSPPGPLLEDQRPSRPLFQ